MLSIEHRKLKNMKCYKVTLWYFGEPEENFVFINLFTALKFMYINRHAFEYSIGVTHIATMTQFKNAVKLQEYLSKFTFIR